MAHFMKNRKARLFVMIVTAIFLIGAAACSSIIPAPLATPTAIPTTVPTTIPTAAAVQPIDGERKLTVNGMERTYFIHLPQGLNNQQSVPLVFVFHGFQENGQYARNYTGLDKISSANGFVVVYPNGSGSGAPSWNAGGCCGYANENNVDDPGFVRSIIADVGTIVNVDGKRIYATGFSNGALLTYRLACEMSDTFAAVAPIAGILLYSPCQPQHPVSLMHIHGLKDTVVPFEGGGLNPGSGQQFSAVELSLATWVKLDGCAGDEKSEKNGVLTHTTYGSCAPGVDVELYTVDGIGHSWPSPYIVPMSQMVWDFFAAHPKP